MQDDTKKLIEGLEGIAKGEALDGPWPGRLEQRLSVLARAVLFILSHLGIRKPEGASSRPEASIPPAAPSPEAMAGLHRWIRAEKARARPDLHQERLTGILVALVAVQRQLAAMGFPAPEENEPGTELCHLRDPAMSTRTICNAVGVLVTDDRAFFEATKHRCPWCAAELRRDAAAGTGDVSLDDLELEETILAALLSRPGALAEVKDILWPEHFATEAHQRIFEAIRAGYPSDPATVAAAGQEQRWAPGYLEKLVERAPEVASLRAAAHRIVGAAAARKAAAMETCEHCRKSLLEGSHGPGVCVVERGPDGKELPPPRWFVKPRPAPGDDRPPTRYLGTACAREGCRHPYNFHLHGAGGTRCQREGCGCESFLDEERRFYLIKTDITGPLLAFWKTDGRGYATTIAQAGLFTEQEARGYTSDMSFGVPREAVEEHAVDGSVPREQLPALRKKAVRP